MSETEKMPAYLFLLAQMHSMLSVAAQGAAYEGWSDGFARQEVSDCWTDSPNGLRRKVGRRVTIEELQSLDAEQRQALWLRNWNDDLILIPLWMYHYIDPQAELISIMGDVVRASDEGISLDEKFGLLAYGFRSAGWVAKEKADA